MRTSFIITIDHPIYRVRDHKFFGRTIDHGEIASMIAQSLDQAGFENVTVTWTPTLGEPRHDGRKKTQ